MTILAVVLFTISMLCAVAALALRFRIFRRMQGNSIVSDLLEATHMLTFGDLLSLRLFFRRQLVSQPDRWLINAFFITHLIAILSLLLLIPFFA